MTVPGPVLTLAAAAGVDAVGVPAWLGRPVRDYLTSQTSTVRCGSVVTGDSWCWWFVPPGSATAPPGSGTNATWPPPSRYLRIARPSTAGEPAPPAPGSPGAALCTHPIVLSCAIHAFRPQRATTTHPRRPAARTHPEQTTRTTPHART